MNQTTPKNEAAAALGRLARGKPKRLSDAERERRRQAMRLIGQANKHTVTIIAEHAPSDEQMKTIDHDYNRK